MEIIRVKLTSSPKTSGCEKSAIQVIKSLRDIRGKENGKNIDVDKLKLEEVHLDSSNYEEADYLIFENSKESFEKNFKTLFVGGDHSMSYSILRAFKEIYKNNLLIVFDAHADCDDILSVNYKNWLRKLIRDGFNGRKVIIIGARNIGSEDMDFLKKEGVAVMGMDVLRDNLEEVCDLVMERARASEGFYISFDIDCIDPSCAPGTNEIEPGGIDSREAIYFIKRLVLLDNFKGGDINEINLDKDFNEMTVKLGAKLLAEMI